MRRYVDFVFRHYIDVRRGGPAEWLLTAILLGGTALMYAYPPSMWWDVVAEALAVGFYLGRWSLLRQQ